MCIPQTFVLSSWHNCLGNPQRELTWAVEIYFTAQAHLPDQKSSRGHFGPLPHCRLWLDYFEIAASTRIVPALQQCWTSCICSIAYKRRRICPRLERSLVKLRWEITSQYIALLTSAGGVFSSSELCRAAAALGSAVSHGKQLSTLI